MRFVDKCIEIEAQLSQENVELEKQLEDEEIIEAVQIPDQTDLDNAHIVENIEIVVENGELIFYKNIFNYHIYVISY